MDELLHVGSALEIVDRDASLLTNALAAGCPGILGPAMLPVMLDPALTKMPPVATSWFIRLKEPPIPQEPPQVSGEAGAARNSGRNFKMAETVAVASEFPVVADVQAPACAVQPVTMIRTASGSLVAENAAVNPGSTAEPSAAVALPVVGTSGQLQVLVLPEILQP